MQAEPGDKVKVATKEEIYEGILMPRPKLLGNDNIVLKLKNGYNIGIQNKKVSEISVVKKYDEKKKKAKFSSSNNKNKPTVSILSFGGTISSKVDYLSGGVSSEYDAEDLISMEPKLGEMANIKARKVMSAMSEDFLPRDWKLMAKETLKELEKCDAVIITQGTDTMHYSSAALSFFLKGLDKPVIFTAAQRSIDRGSTDAFMNLLCSVRAAVNFDGAGVFVVMHGTSSDDYCYIHKGTKVRKMHSLRRDAFRSINEFPIAKVFYDNDEIEYLHDNYPKKNTKTIPAKSGRKKEGKSLGKDISFEEKVALVYVYPGMDPGIIDFYLDKKYKGLVLAATALGHVPTSNEKSLMPQLERAKKEKVPVVITGQCFYGRVDPLVYSNLRKLSREKEAIFAEDMLPEVAYVKLGWLLSKKGADIMKDLLESVAGEINYSHDPRAFLN